jgi:hypothetical protein
MPDTSAPNPLDAISDPQPLAPVEPVRVLQEIACDLGVAAATVRRESPASLALGRLENAARLIERLMDNQFAAERAMRQAALDAMMRHPADAVAVPMLAQEQGKARPVARLRAVAETV